MPLAPPADRATILGFFQEITPNVQRWLSERRRRTINLAGFPLRDVLLVLMIELAPERTIA
jgi:hypothetical protein